MSFPKDAQRKGGRNSQHAENPKSHGVYAVRDNGREALDPTQIEALGTLKEKVKSHPGRVDLYAELWARVHTINQMAYAYLREQIEQNGTKAIADEGIMKRLGTYMNLEGRLLRDWPAETAGDLASQMIDNTESTAHGE